MKVEIIPASSAPEVLTECRYKRNPHRGRVAQMLLDAKVGDWLRIPLSDLPGSSNLKKEGNLSNGMKARKLRICSRILGAHIWFQVREVVPSTPAAK